MKRNSLRSAVFFGWWFMVALGEGARTVGPFASQIECEYVRVALKGTTTSPCWDDGKK